MRYLNSADGSQLFKVDDYFFNGYWEVFESDNKWGYMQKKDVSVKALDEPFKGFYCYDSHLNISFRTNFKNFDHVQIGKIHHKNKKPEPTYCNKSTGEFIKFFGLDDLAWKFKTMVGGANTLFDYMMGCSNTSGSKIIRVDYPNRYASYRTGILTIAMLKGYLKPGRPEEERAIGHVAPYIGLGMDGLPYVANKGLLENDGVHTIKRSFGTGMGNISFFEIHKL